MGKLEYESNNSGGDWWLMDEDWKKLEKEGWDVEWRRDMNSPYSKPDKNGRWLGALATKASKEFPTAQEGVEEWERITGENASALGCTCCGPPHEFMFTDDSGERHFGSARITTVEMGWS